MTPCTVYVVDSRPDEAWILWAQRSPWATRNKANGFHAPATHVPVPSSLKAVPPGVWAEVDISSLLAERLPSVPLEKVHAVGVEALLITTGGSRYLGDMRVSFRKPGAPVEMIGLYPRYVWQIVGVPGSGDRQYCRAVVPVTDGKFEVWIHMEVAGRSMGVGGYDHPQGPTFGVNMWMTEVFVKE